MKKSILLAFLVLRLHPTLYSQDALMELSKKYFRSDPFSGTFSGFLDHLLNDPAIVNKQTRQRTDTSLFYFSGIYTRFNPFFFKPARVEVTLAQLPVQSGSMPADTVLVYQLMAFADSSQRGQAEVRQEFEKIHRQFRRKFYKSLSQELQPPGEIRHYFVGYTRLSPVTLAWGKLEHEFVISLVLRIKQQNNQALLPAAFYDSQ